MSRQKWGVTAWAALMYGLMGTPSKVEAQHGGGHSGGGHSGGAHSGASSHQHSAHTPAYNPPVYHTPSYSPPVQHTQSIMPSQTTTQHHTQSTTQQHHHATTTTQATNNQPTTKPTTTASKPTTTTTNPIATSSGSSLANSYSQFYGAYSSGLGGMSSRMPLGYTTGIQNYAPQHSGTIQDVPSTPIAPRNAYVDQQHVNTLQLAHLTLMSLDNGYQGHRRNAAESIANAIRELGGTPPDSDDGSGVLNNLAGAKFQNKTVPANRKIEGVLKMDDEPKGGQTALISTTPAGSIKPLAEAKPNIAIDKPDLKKVANAVADENPEARAKSDEQVRKSIELLEEVRGELAQSSQYVKNAVISEYLRGAITELNAALKTP